MARSRAGPLFLIIIVHLALACSVQRKVSRRRVTIKRLHSIRGGKEWGFAGHSDDGSERKVEARWIGDPGFERDFAEFSKALGNKTEEYLRARSMKGLDVLSGSEDMLEQASSRLKRLNISGNYTKPMDQVLKEIDEMHRQEMEKSEKSEEGVKRREAKEKKEREEIEKEEWEMEHGRPWENLGGKWVTNGNFSKVEKLMFGKVMDADADALSADLTADELNTPDRTAALGYRGFVEDEKLRRYQPRKWTRRVHLKNDMLYKQELRSNFTRDAGIDEEGSDIGEREEEAIQEKLLEEKKRIRERDDYDIKHEIERLAYEKEDELYLESNKTVDEIQQEMDRFREVLNRNVEEFRNRAEGPTLMEMKEHIPEELEFPRRPLTESNSSWLLEVYVELGDILVDMKLNDYKEAKEAFISISYFVRKLYNDPHDEKAREIKTCELHPMIGVQKFFEAMGFVEKGAYLILPKEHADVWVFRSSFSLLEEALNNKYFGCIHAEERHTRKMKEIDPNYDTTKDYQTHMPGFVHSDHDCDEESLKERKAQKMIQIAKEKADFGINDPYFSGATGPPL